MYCESHCKVYGVLFWHCLDIVYQKKCRQNLKFLKASQSCSYDKLHHRAKLINFEVYDFFLPYQDYFFILGVIHAQTANVCCHIDEITKTRKL